MCAIPARPWPAGLHVVIQKEMVERGIAICRRFGWLDESFSRWRLYSKKPRWAFLVVRKVIEQSGICPICQLSFENETHKMMSLDHVVPVKEGGISVPDNLQATHRWCNNFRGHGQHDDAEVTRCARAKILRYRRNRDRTQAKATD